MMIGFAMMLITGFLLYYAIPVRTTQSLWFRIKVVLLIVAGINAFLFRAKMQASSSSWDLDPYHPSAYAWVQCCRWSYGLGLSSQAAQSRTTGLTATNNCLTPCIGRRAVSMKWLPCNKAGVTE
ncbi:MAG: hypothetical protein CM15mP120_28670 [Pseudomonadota bacterium]|nr:MAG: hypothetical protein CM15mP120_28670 [Pseudomonadota bacterium]